MADASVLIFTLYFEKLNPDMPSGFLNVFYIHIKLTSDCQNVN